VKNKTIKTAGAASDPTSCRAAGGDRAAETVPVALLACRLRARRSVVTADTCRRSTIVALYVDEARDRMMLVL